MSANEERLRKFIRIIDVIEKYEYYLLRRAIGNFYIGIIAIVATCVFLYLSIITTFDWSGYISLIIILLGSSLIAILWVTTFRFKTILTRVKIRSKPSGYWVAIYIILCLLWVLKYSVMLEIPDSVFPPILTILLGIGNVGLYLERRGMHYPGVILKEFLVLGLVFIVAGFGIAFVPDVCTQWIITAIVLWIGMILFGLYVSLTASKVFQGE